MKLIVSHLRAHPRLLIATGIGTVIALAAPGIASPVTRALLGWNVSVWLYLVSVGWMMSQADPESVKRVAMAQAEGALAVLAFAAAAKGQAGNYQPGDKIEYLDYGVWEKGVFVGATPGDKQPIIRKKPSEFYPEGSQTAFDWERIRPLGAAPAVTTVPAQPAADVAPLPPPPTPKKPRRPAQALRYAP